MILRQVIAFYIFILLFVPAISSAQVNDQADRNNLIAELLEQIEFLQRILLERASFFEIGAVDKSPDDPEYFTFFDVSKEDTIFGSQSKDFVFQTDGSVNQLLILTDCKDVDGTLMINGRECTTFNWVSDFEETEGIRTYTVPFEIYTEDTRESMQLDIYACRYIGCQKEVSKTVFYKSQKTFADYVKIYDRYEWTYEWNGNTYHVQEVLLNFPIDNLKRVKLDVDCEGEGLYIRTDEENRATCYSSRDYSQVDFGDLETDELGNTYNLRVESVTDEVKLNESGLVTMEFTFINRQNQIVHRAKHVPLQLESGDK